MNCSWPKWLDSLYANPESLEGKVHIYSHPTYGYVYAIGPEEGTVDEKTSISLSWYDQHGEWLGMTNHSVLMTEAKKFLSLKTYQDYCKQSPFSCSNLLSPDSPSWLKASSKKPEDRLWWSTIDLVCQSKPLKSPKRCRIPSFITPTWLKETFGYPGYAIARPPGISELRIDEYLHDKLGPVYTVVDKRMADSSTAWYNQNGEFIHSSYVPGWDHPSAKQVEENKKWNDAVHWQKLCR